MQESPRPIRRPLQSLLPDCTALSSPSDSVPGLMAQTTGNKSNNSPPACHLVPTEGSSSMQDDCGSVEIERRSEEYPNDSLVPQFLQIPEDLMTPFAMAGSSPAFDIDTFLDDMPPQFGIPFIPSLTSFDFERVDSLALDPSTYMQYVETFNIKEHECHSSSTFAHLEGSNSQAPITTVNSPTKMPFSDPAILLETPSEPQDLSWSGSLKVSEKKRAELMNAINHAVTCST